MIRLLGKRVLVAVNVNWARMPLSSCSTENDGAPDFMKSIMLGPFICVKQIENIVRVISNLK